MRDKSSRREFFKQSAKVAAGAIILPTSFPHQFRQGREYSASDRIVIGAIGTGSQGMSNMRDFLELKNAVQFAAVCDVDALHLAKAKQMVDEANKNTDCRRTAITGNSLKRRNSMLSPLHCLITGMDHIYSCSQQKDECVR